MKVQKSITLDKSVSDKVEKERKVQGRKFSQMVNYILRRWFEDQEFKSKGK